MSLYCTCDPGDQGATGGATHQRLLNLVVAAELALAVVLLSAAGLMLTSVAKLSRVTPGFDAGKVLTFRLAMTASNYEPAPSRIALVSSLLERLAASPEVQNAAVISTIPFGGSRVNSGPIFRLL